MCKLQSWTKVLGTVVQYSFVSLISRFPHKTVHPFRNFLAVLPLPPYTKLKLEKILDTRVQHCLWGEGRGWTCVNWKTPMKCKSVPRLLSMTVVVWDERWRRILHTSNRLPWETACAFWTVPRSLPESFLVFPLPSTHKQTY